MAVLAGYLPVLVVDNELGALVLADLPAGVDGVLLRVEVTAAAVSTTRALELAKDCHAAYAAADSNVRRLFNQAFFEKIYVHDDGEATHDLAEPFKILLDPELPHRLAIAARDEKLLPDWLDSDSLWLNDDGLVNDEAVGSNMMVLVGPAGLEPATDRL